MTGAKCKDKYLEKDLSVGCCKGLSVHPLSCLFVGKFRARQTRDAWLQAHLIKVSLLKPSPQTGEGPQAPHELQANVIPEQWNHQY